MSRSYRNVRPKKHWVYSVDQVQELYSVHRNTITNWVRSGLRATGGTGPQLFRGAELARFHVERLERTHKQLRPGEFKCVKCKAAVFPEIGKVTIDKTSDAKWMARSVCPDCSGIMLKLLGETEHDFILSHKKHNTSLVPRDETETRIPAGVVKIDGGDVSNWCSLNDRILFEWLKYATKYDGKSTDAHLRAIREFEALLQGKCFGKLKSDDAVCYKQHLIERLALPRAQGGLSKSSVSHRLASLREFVKWLKDQQGYRRINASLPGYFAVPRKVSAPVSKTTDKLFPTIDEAWNMVEAMPSHQLIQRRDRAIVALAFTAGLRANALISLRRKHVDEQSRTVFQDAREVRAKNGKSYTAKWFPRTDRFEGIVRSWLLELDRIGFGPEDALFPSKDDLARPSPKDGADHVPVVPMATSDAVARAFSEASKLVGKSYTPHSARHCLKALGDKMCRTLEERKAWSKNLGHSSEKVTETYYAKMTESQSAELIDRMRSEQKWSDEEKELMLDYLQHLLTRGTPEFERARTLVEARARLVEEGKVLE
ncbi:tyrosine-type recombinase/integrase [Shimia sp. CNT1-13L.2]|uniref:tyrosine-type recombinase/integrase n=1 Tax=Shimia sp. CNT1-13L.2 TaxID=2959663 RepID=UPI0020CEE1F7|nr:tyrosine-type recombinase/integrase [Shimia sp. CNT1-13L.2]MCP9482670.1 tyrosine-type recombinase/integrase [Shimia sp. CNT1-13L.2]